VACLKRDLEGPNLNVPICDSFNPARHWEQGRKDSLQERPECYDSFDPARHRQEKEPSGQNRERQLPFFLAGAAELKMSALQYPELGIVVIIKNRCEFINSCFIPSSIRYPICNNCEVQEHFQSYSKKSSLLNHHLKDLRHFVSSNDSLKLFEEELNELSKFAEIRSKYFKILFERFHPTRFDATDFHNFCVRFDFRLRKLIDRIAIYIESKICH